MPRSITFLASSVGDGTLLTGFVDPPSAQAVLTAVEKPPPLPKPAAEPTQEQGPPEDPHRIESSAYAFLLTMRGIRSGDIVITDHTATTDMTLDDAAQLASTSPDVRASVLEDFVRKNKEARPFPSGLVIPGVKVVLLSSEEERSFFGKHEKGWDGWREFRKVHGQTAIVTFSRVGLSHDRTQAMIYMGSQADWLAGGGSLYILQRKGDSWEVLYEMPLWIS